MATTTVQQPPVFGLMAEFDDRRRRQRREARPRSRLPADRHVLAISDRRGLGSDRASRSRLSTIVLGGGLTGSDGRRLQEWVHQIAYPINIAGKPLNSWPQFVP